MSRLMLLILLLGAAGCLGPVASCSSALFLVWRAVTVGCRRQACSHVPADQHNVRLSFSHMYLSLTQNHNRRYVANAVHGGVFFARLVDMIVWPRETDGAVPCWIHNPMPLR